MIAWQPIEELPEELKDGREVLVWDGYADVARWNANREWGEGAGWSETCEGGPVDDVTHFCAINKP